MPVRPAKVCSWRLVAALLTISVFLGACAPAAQPSPTAAPAKPTAAPKAAASPAASPVAKPAASPAASPVAKPAASPAASPGAIPAAKPAPQLTQPVNLRFATQEVGGGWYVYGATMAEMLKPTLPNGSTVDVLPHAAGIGNPKSLGTKQADIGFAFGTTATWGHRGIVAYEEKYENLRALIGGFDRYYVGTVVRKGLGITSLTDIKDKNIPLKLYTVPRGGLGEFANRQALEAIGLSYDAIQRQGGSVQHIGFNVITGAFRDGRADMLMHTVNKGHPSMTEIATVADVDFLPLPDASIAAMREVGWEPVEMPANTFPKQDRAVKTVGDSTILIANTDLPDDVAYVITKTLVENREALGAANAALRDFDPEQAVKALSIPLHPGAERYYRDRGWLQ